MTRARHTLARRLTAVLIGALLLAGCSTVPKGRDVASTPRSSSTGGTIVRREPSPSLNQCYASLTRAQANFTPLPDRDFGNGCSQFGSVELASLDLAAANPGAGTLAIANLGPITCPLADKFAGWAQFGAARAARQILGAELVRIDTFGSYACRNIAGSGRLSQHAHANAIDIAAFVLDDGRRISVEQYWHSHGREREFLKVLHDSACKRFGTVLGPDFNAAHRDHFHVDMSGQGYCR